MDFEKSNISENMGRITGNVFAYFLFTTIIFFILVFFKETRWLYPQVMALTFLVVLTGIILRRLLK